MRSLVIGVIMIMANAQSFAVDTYCWGGKWEGQCCTNHIFGSYSPGKIHVICESSRSRRETKARYQKEMDRLSKRTWEAVRQGIEDSIARDTIRKWTTVPKGFVDAKISPSIDLFLRLLKQAGNHFRVTAIKGAYHKTVYCDKKTPNGHCAGLAVDLVPLDKRWYKTRSSIRIMMPRGVRYKALLLDKDSCPECTGKHIHFEFLSDQDAATFMVQKTSRLYQEF